MQITRRSILASSSLLAWTGFDGVASAQGAVSQPVSQHAPAADAARAVALQAYLYFYPLISMDITRRQSTNVEAGKEIGKGPMNSFVNIAAYPAADLRMVVRPNFDTLYSSAWLDLTKEAVVVSAPDTDGRYYLLPMLDMWTDVFASPGWRTTGTHAQDLLVVPPGWRGDVPAGMSRIDAPTPFVWIIGRTKTDGPADYDAVHKIQAGYQVTPLSLWGKPRVAPVATIDPTVDMRTPTKMQVDNMPAEKYFAYAAELLKIIPPHVTDEPMIALLKTIGFEAGKSYEIETLDPAVRGALDDAVKEAQQLMLLKMPSLARIVNGWSMNTDTMGVYGNYYLKRAIVAQYGLGANLPEDAIYPANLADASGRTLDGANTYTLHFGDRLPARAFWSITLYDSQGFQVANPIDRFAISSWMPLRYNKDGSLDLFFQKSSPGQDKEANWLPCPQGEFNLLMRLYAPDPEVLIGNWTPPAVKRTS